MIGESLGDAVVWVVGEVLLTGIQGPGGRWELPSMTVWTDLSGPLYL